MNDDQRINRVQNIWIDPNDMTERTALLRQVKHDLLLILNGNLLLIQAQNALNNALAYLVINNSGDEDCRLARYVRNHCQRIINENQGLPPPRPLLERQFAEVPGQFFGKKRVNPKNKISCMKANMNWVKSHKSKDKKGKSVKVKGACRKKNYN